MNWRKPPFNWSWRPEPFNPWTALAPADPGGEAAHDSKASSFRPPKITSDAMTEDSLARNAMGSATIRAPMRLPRDDGDDSGEWLGIGACMMAPWRLASGRSAEEEERLSENRKTISVSKREVGPVRQLVATALKTYSGVTLDYARILNDELSQATILPPSRLPSDVVTLHSRVWVTDMENGQSTIVTLVMPHQTGAHAGRISILSPLGMAIFGYEADDCLDWGPDYRTICVRIDRVRRPPAARVRANAIPSRNSEYSVSGEGCGAEILP